MIIDTHSHLQFHAFKEDEEEVIKRTLAENIWMINVGTKYQTSKSAVELAQKYSEGVFAAIGLHPIYAAAEFLKLKHDSNEEERLISENGFDKEKYLALAKSKKVVAIGEIGLDYYYKPKSKEKLAQFKEKQKRVFLEQLDLAKELDLPVILHCRVAHDDVIQILKSYIINLKSNPAGVIHCFTGTWEQAQKYIGMGFCLGINGIIFKFNIDEVIKNISLEKLVVETDCPYLTPLPAVASAKEGKPEGDNPSSRAELTTKQRRNEPIFIKHTIQRIAELKGISFDEVAQKTTENAKRLFGI